MAVIRIHAQKDARCMQAVCQINGDRRTQILRFDVNRFDGGVDLGGLRWVIKTTNALGVEDIFDPEVVEIKERTITVDWLVNGSVTDGDGMATYELNGIDTADDGQPVQWSGGLGSISVRAGQGPKFGESDGMTNIEKLILYVEGELEGVVEAGSAALDAAERANHAADVLGDPAEAVDRANAAAQRAETAADTVGDLEAAVNRANTATANTVAAINDASVAASEAFDAAARAEEAAKNVENIEEATLAAHEAAEAANLAAATAAEAALPHVQLYGRRVMGEVAKVSGNPVTCLADAGSLLQPVTVLEPQQEGSGEPSPDNIRPIAGYDKLDLSVAGKNLFDFKKPRSNTSSTTYEVDGDAIRIYTSAEGGTWKGVNYDYITLKAGVKYTFSIDVLTYTSGYMYYGPRRRSNNVFMKSCVATGTGHYTSTVTPSEDVEAYMALLVTNDTVTTGDITFANAQIATGAETAYAPYHNKLHTVQIGQTVYGGKMDWLTGKLAVEWFVEDITSAKVHSRTGAFQFRVKLDNKLLPTPTATIDALCSHFPYKTASSGASASGLITNNGNVYIRHLNLGEDTIEAFRVFVDAQVATGAPLQIGGKLAEPIEIQFTPAVISAVEPEQTNTLYGDGGIEVEYVKPLHVSIDERVAAAVAAAMQT